MSNIFISYSKKDTELANSIRLNLKSEGYDVWWDNNLIAGNPWEEEIHNALKKSEIILILWTNNSIKSDWVKHEASIAKLKGNLIQVFIDDISFIPSIFQTIQSSNLTDWNMRENDTSFVALLESIKLKIKKRKKKKYLSYLKDIIFLLIISCLALYLFIQCGNTIYENSSIEKMVTNQREKPYIDNSNGTITDAQTNLMWKKCSEGQKYESSRKTCTGLTKHYTWKHANDYFSSAEIFANYNDWRLPNERELETLIWCSNGTLPENAAWGCDGKNNDKGFYKSPTIDKNAFPNTEKGGYLSTTTGTYKKQKTYWVRWFSSGGKYGDSSDEIKGSVRLVRELK